MKKQDILFVIGVAVLLLPFFVSEPVFRFYHSFNAEHGMVMSFIKFAVLSTLGEMIGARISTGAYARKGFGILPRMLVWGILGMGINAAMIIFSNGTPVFLQYLGMQDAVEVFQGEGISWRKAFVAFIVSVSMNTFFAPVFMTLHKITDTHILATGGSLRGFFTPLDMGKIMSGLNWQALWGFVFKKTIPFFWFPALAGCGAWGAFGDRGTPSPIETAFLFPASVKFLPVCSCFNQCLLQPTYLF